MVENRIIKCLSHSSGVLSESDNIRIPVGFHVTLRVFLLKLLGLWTEMLEQQMMNFRMVVNNHY